MYKPKTKQFTTNILRPLAAIIFLFIGGMAQAVDIDFKLVAEGVYAYIGDTDGRTYDNEGLNANIGLIITSDGAILIDSGATFQSAKKIHEAAKRVTSQPINWVINTGGQDHRWLGNGYFRAQGAELIAHSKEQADMQARSLAQLQGLSILKERIDGTVPTLPTRLLQDNDKRLQLGGVTLEIKFRGGGHTPGDILVWLPQKNVLFSGDVIYVDRILGLIPVSSSKTWLQSFAVVDDLKPQIIVPGHGNVTSLTTVQSHTRDLLIALREHVKKSIDGDGDMNLAVKSFNAKPFSHLKHAEVWLPQLVNATYLEVERE
jgi:glyoxylase-like metal-dependent hydrolase (beta-lactamase superfamily II)